MTIKDYYNIIVATKEGEIDLQELQPYNDSGAEIMRELDSGSKVAIWRLWCWVSAAFAWMVGESFALHKTEVKHLISTSYFGTEKWIHAKVLEFQFGYGLNWNGTHEVYSVVDTSAQIIAQASIQTLDGIVRIKAAKEDSGSLQPLSLSEKNGLTNYMRELLAPGIDFRVISEPPDQLKIHLTCYINSQIIGSNGAHILTGENDIVNAATAYVENLEFDGRFNILKFTDALQSVEGLEDVAIHEIASKYGALEYVPIEREIVPFSGYMILDFSVSNIQYIDYV